MRDKVILVKGNDGFATQITIAPFERIVADHVVLIVGLKYPQCLPEGYYDGKTLDPNRILEHAADIVRYWAGAEQEHLISAEYASMVLDYGRRCVKAVEGNCLFVPWFFETLRVLHRNLGHQVVEVEIIPNSDNVLIDGVSSTRDEALTKMKPASWLG